LVDHFISKMHATRVHMAAAFLFCVSEQGREAPRQGRKGFFLTPAGGGIS